MKRGAVWAALAGLVIAAIAPSASAEILVASVFDPVAVDPAPELVKSFGVQPSLASDGQTALVLYTAGFDGGDIWLRLIGPDAKPLGAPFGLGVELGGVATTPPPSVVFDGDSYVVRWVESSVSVAKSYYRRFNTAGIPLGPASLRDERGNGKPFWQKQIGSAGEGKVLFVSCTGQSTCSFQILAGDTLLPAREVTFPAAVRNVSATYSDGTWAVAVSHDAVTFLQIGADGAPIDEVETTVDTSPYVSILLAPAADGFAVAWPAAEGWRIGSYDFDGALTTKPGFGGQDTQPTLLCRAGGELLAFVSRPKPNCNGCFETFMQPLDSALAPVGGSTAIAATSCPASAAEQLLFARPYGSTLSGFNVELTEPPHLGAEQAWSESAAEMVWPLSAPVGDGWAMAWTETTDTGVPPERARMTFLSSDGTPLQPPFDVAEDVRHLDLACRSSTCLSAVGQLYGIPSGTVRRVADGASSADLGLVLSWQGNVSLAASPQGFAILHPLQSSLVLNRVHCSGELRDEVTVATLADATTFPVARALQVVFDGEGYVAVWFDSLKVYSKRIPLVGAIGAEPPAVLSSYTMPLELHAAYQSTDWWLSFNPFQAPEYGAGKAPTPAKLSVWDAVGTGNAALFATTRDGGSDAELSLAMPGEAPTVVQSFAGESLPDLSSPRNHQLLFVSAKPDSSWGAPALRIRTRIVNLQGDSGEAAPEESCDSGVGGSDASGGQGGAGGQATNEGGAGGAGGDPGGANAGGVGGTGGDPNANAGAPGNNAAGEATGGTGVDGTAGQSEGGGTTGAGKGGTGGLALGGSPAGTDEAGAAGESNPEGPSAPRSSRTSSGCGCRTAGSSSNGHFPYALALLGLLAARRRRPLSGRPRR